MKYGRVGQKSRQVLQLSTASIEAYEGAVRSSKTITVILDFARFLRSDLRGEFAIVGRTERTAFRNVVQPMIDMFGRSHVRYNRGLGQLTVFGRTGYIIGANNESSTAKIQGLTLLALMIDEAATIPESFFNMSYTRLTLPGAKMWITANPEGRSHWLKVKWLDRARLWVQRDGTVITDDRPVNVDGEAGPLNLHRYTFTIDDNDYLADEKKAQLKTSYTGVWHLRYILSEWTNAEGAIYDMWDESVHVIDSVPGGVSIERRIVAVDYGTAGVFSAGMLGLGSDGVIYAVDEWRHAANEGEARWTDAQLSKGFQSWLAKYPPVDWIAVDPSATSFITQLRHERVQRVVPAINTVVPGIRAVASLLQIGRLKICQARVGLIKEIPGYVWDAKAAERGEDKPVKENDHSVDDLRYAVQAAIRTWSISRYLEEAV